MKGNSGFQQGNDRNKAGVSKLKLCGDDANSRGVIFLPLRGIVSARALLGGFYSPPGRGLSSISWIRDFNISSRGAVPHKGSLVHMCLPWVLISLECLVRAMGNVT